MIDREYCLAIPGSVRRQQVISALRPYGFHMTGEGSSCVDLLRVLRKTQPYLAVIDLSLPGDVLGTAAIIEDEGLSAVLLLSGKGSVSGSPVSACPFVTLPFPVAGQVLLTAAEVLCLEFSHKRKLAAEVRELRSRLQSRIAIERAKGIIMNELAVEEQQAYRFLQKLSMETRRPLKDIAGSILKEGIKRFTTKL